MDEALSSIITERRNAMREKLMCQVTFENKRNAEKVNDAEYAQASEFDKLYMRVFHMHEANQR